MTTIGHWIAGQVVTGALGRAGPVYDPATGAQTGEVAFASAAEVEAAVKQVVDVAAATTTR